VRKLKQVVTDATPNIQHTPTLMRLEHGKEIFHLFSRFLPLETTIVLLPN
jgi:hypothetical protein